MKPTDIHTKRRGFKPMVFVPIILIFLVVLWSIYFFRNGKNKTRTDIVQTDIPFKKQGTLSFLSANNDTIIVIDIEVADNNQKREQGLMYRSSLPANAGMLFLMDNEQIQSFWMKNTHIPLDIVFADAQKQIVSISPNTPTESTSSILSSKPALYVVEVNGGFCNQHGISAGDKIAFVIDK